MTASVSTLSRLRRIQAQRAAQAKKNELTNTSLNFMAKMHLLVGADYERVNQLSGASLAEHFNRRKAHVLTSRAQKCINSKFPHYETIRKQFAPPWDRYLSFNQLFMLWIEDLIALYRDKDPEDDTIMTCERNLIVALAAWRRGMKEDVRKVALENALQQIMDKVRVVAPNENDFLQMRSAFEALLYDKCSDDHWDPDILGVELAEYRLDRLKSAILKGDEYFPLPIEPGVYENLFRGECVLTLKKWEYILPHILDIYETHIRSVNNKLNEVEDVVDRAVYAKQQSLNDQTIKDFIDKACFALPGILSFYARVPIHLIGENRDRFDYLIEFRTRYLTNECFPSYIKIPSDDEIAKSIKKYYTNPEQIVPFMKERAATTQKINEILEAYVIEHICNVLKHIETLHKYHERIKKANAEDASKNVVVSVRSPEPLKAIASTNVEKPKKIKEVVAPAAATPAVEKPKKVSAPAKAPLAAKKVIKPPKSIPKPIKVREEKIVVESVPTESIFSFSAGMGTETDIVKIRFAAHGDLYRQYVRAVKVLLNRYEDDLVHALNLRRMACLVASLTLETSVNFDACKQGKEIDTSTHNLRKLWRVTGNAELKSCVELFDGVSNFARFTHDQLRRNTSYNTRILNSRIAPYLSILSGESTLNADLITLTHDLERFASVMECGKIERRIDVPSISSEDPIHSAGLENLISAVESLEQETWVKQWLDDLRCLNSSLILLNETLALDEYSALTAHIHFLIHAIVQSPLYALREEKGLSFTSSHDLIQLWVEVNGQIPKEVEDFLNRNLHDACNIARYPYRHPEPISSMHRMQLETIAVMHTPEILEDYQFVCESKEATLAHKLGWTPILQNIKKPKAQKTQILLICDELIGFLRSEILPKFPQQV